MSNWTEWKTGHFEISDYKHRPELNGKYSNDAILKVLSDAEQFYAAPGNFIHNLDMDEWTDDFGRDITPRQFLADPTNERYATHLRRVQNADIAYPIIIWLDQDKLNNPHYIVDGMHRYIKATWLHYKTVKLVQLTDHRLSLIKQK